MLLQKKSTIEELIIKILSKNPNLSVNEILQSIKKHNNYSQRGVYKELKKLELDGILIKTKNKYNLDLSWIIQVSQFVDQAYSTYSNISYLEKTLSISDKKQTHYFSDLLRMDHYWVQMLIALHKILPNEPLYLWCPYQWFNLIQNYNISHFYEASDNLGAYRYHIMGSPCYLNQRALKELPKNGKYSLNPGSFKDERHINYSLIGDYILYVTTDKIFTKNVEELFSKVKNEDQLINYKVKRIFLQKSKSKLVIEKNHQKANALRARFEEHFRA